MTDLYPYFSPLPEPQWQGEMPPPTVVGDQDVGFSDLKANADHSHQLTPGAWQPILVSSPWSTPGSPNRLGEYTRVGTLTFVRGYFAAGAATAAPSTLGTIPIDFAPRNSY